MGALLASLKSLLLIAAIASGLAGVALMIWSIDIMQSLRGADAV